MGTMERRMLALQETFNDFHDFPPFINVNRRACYCWTIGGEDINLLGCLHDCAVSRFARKTAVCQCGKLFNSFIFIVKLSVPHIF